MRKFILLLLFVFVFSSVCRAGMNTGLASWWKLNDGQGTMAVDSSGNSYDGTLSGQATWTQGLVSAHALSFDGNSGFVQVPNGILDLTAVFSISLWISPSSFNVLPDSNKQRLLSLVGKDGGTLDLAIFPKGVSGRLSFITTAGGGRKSMITSDATLDSGYWYLVILVYDGNSYTMYVNGQSEDLVNGGINSAGRENSYIASTNNIYGAGYFQGLIEDVRLYNRALTSSEVADFYHSLVNTGNQSP